MSDNVTPLDPERNQKAKRFVWTKKIIVFTAILVVVCTVVGLMAFTDGFNADTLRRWVKYMNVDYDGDYGSFSFDSHSSNRYGNFDGGLIVASVSGLRSFDENGKEKFTVQQQMELPQLQVEGDYALAYDVGGSDLAAIHRRSGAVLQLEEKRPILDADLSEGGYLCLSTSASGYKSVLAVYNPKQDLIYRWLSSTTYIPLCAISQDGMNLAAIALGQSGGSFESELYFFRTDAEDIQKKVSLGTDLIYDVLFLNKSTVCAIGETGVQFFNLQGEPLGTCSYDGQFLKDYDDGGDGFLALAVNMYRAGNRYTLMTVDEMGQPMATAYLGQEILDLSACGKYLAVLTPEGLTIYHPSLSVYHETVETGNATSVVMRSDGSVLLLGNGQGRLYIP